jgi:trigger factor
MQVTETKTEGLKRDFKIVVPATDIENRITARLEQLSQTVRIPGFRPGKVPVSLLRKRYGPSVLGEVLERTVGEMTMKAMTEHGLRPAMQPKVEITSFEEGKDLEYTMAVEVLPEIAPVDFSKIELERMTVDVEDGEVEEVLTRMAEANKVSEPVATERKAEKGDVVVIDFVGKIDGKEFPAARPRVITWISVRVVHPRLRGPTGRRQGRRSCRRQRDLPEGIRRCRPGRQGRRLRCRHQGAAQHQASHHRR